VPTEARIGTYENAPNRWESASSATAAAIIPWGLVLPSQLRLRLDCRLRPRLARCWHREFSPDRHWKHRLLPLRFHQHVVCTHDPVDRLQPGVHPHLDHRNFQQPLDLNHEFRIRLVAIDLINRFRGLAKV
jgi:hypothetical protein